MRKSRLYLSLSIISMIAAVGVGIAQTHCDRYSGRHECSIIIDHEEYAYEAFKARNFNAIGRHAKALTLEGNKLAGRRWSAYALRGQSKFDEAIAAYHESMHRESGREIPRPLLIDSYVGLADCFAELGLRDRAKEWIGRANSEACTELERHPDDAAHYQLACVLAVQSRIEDSEPAEKLRALAIRHLQLAIGKGFDSWDHMRADIDLDALRGEAQFQALFPKN